MVLLKNFRLSIKYQPEESNIKNLMLENKINREEAIGLDYEKNWREKCVLFSHETRCIIELYLKHFPKFKTEDCKLIVFHCVKQVTDSKMLNSDGILELQLHYDYDRYFKLSDLEKKREILEVLQRGINIVLKDKKWDKAAFNIAYQKVIDADYVNEWFWKKNIKNPTKEYAASVYCEHNIDSFDINIILKNKKGEEIKRKKILSLIPNEMIFNSYLGQLKWVSDYTVSLINEFETKQWSITI